MSSGQPTRARRLVLHFDVNKTILMKDGSKNLSSVTLTVNSTIYINNDRYAPFSQMQHGVNSSLRKCLLIKSKSNGNKHGTSFKNKSLNKHQRMKKKCLHSGKDIFVGYVYIENIWIDTSQRRLLKKFQMKLNVTDLMLRLSNDTENSFNVLIQDQS